MTRQGVCRIHLKVGGYPLRPRNRSRNEKMKKIRNLELLVLAAYYIILLMEVGKGVINQLEGKEGRN